MQKDFHDILFVWFFVDSSVTTALVTMVRWMPRMMTLLIILVGLLVVGVVNQCCCPYLPRWYGTVGTGTFLSRSFSTGPEFLKSKMKEREGKRGNEKREKKIITILNNCDL